MCFLKRPLNLTKSPLNFWQTLRFLCFPHDFWNSVKKKTTRLMKSPLYFWQIFVSAEFSDFFKMVQNYVSKYCLTVQCTAVYLNHYFYAWVGVLWPFPYLDFLQHYRHSSCHVTFLVERRTNAIGQLPPSSFCAKQQHHTTYTMVEKILD